MRQRRLVTSFAVLCCLVLAGCTSTRSLVGAPTIYQSGQGYPESDVAVGLRSNTLNVLYVTDRAPEVSAEGTLTYGAHRSHSMAFGDATVRFGNELSWEQIVSVSSQPIRDTGIELTIDQYEERERFPDTPIPFAMVEGQLRTDPVLGAEYDASLDRFQDEITRRAKEIGTSDAVIFVHGFNNTLDDAVFAMADLSHYSVRSAVPIVYSWPAAAGGPFGYFTDRESGEFTIFHLKEVLRHVAANPSIERIHIIAHSRGTDITTTALRELIIEARGAGADPRLVLRVETLTLAAPDLDLDVVKQRLIAERVGPAIGQINIYLNRSDQALALSERLMSGTRFGRVESEDLGERVDAIFERVTNVNFILVEGDTGLIGHGYFREHPGVLSDIIAIVRTGAGPGSEIRPLINQGRNFWRLPSGYPIVSP